MGYDKAEIAYLKVALDKDPNDAELKRQYAAAVARQLNDDVAGRDE